MHTTTILLTNLPAIIHTARQIDQDGGPPIRGTLVTMLTASIIWHRPEPRPGPHTTGNDIEEQRQQLVARMADLTRQLAACVAALARLDLQIQLTPPQCPVIPLRPTPSPISPLPHAQAGSTCAHDL